MNRDGWGKVVVSQNGQETNSSEFEGWTDPEVMAEEIPYWDPFHKPIMRNHDQESDSAGGGREV